MTQNTAPNAPEKTILTGKRRSKFWLYLPFIIFGLIIAAYSGYWVFVKGKLETGVDAFIAQQQEDGAQITFASKRLHGYPFRFTLTVEKPRFANPEAEIDWTGEKLQINMQPWNFFHAIIRSSGRNELTLPAGQNYTALLGPGSALSLNWNEAGISQIGLTLDRADIVTAVGDIALNRFKASLLQAGADLPGKRVLIDWEAITLSDDIIALLGDDASFLGNEIQASRLRLEGQGFGIFGEADTRKAEIAQLLLNWGPVKLGTKGKFNINTQGYPDGTLQVRLDDAQALGKILREKALLNSETALLYGPLSLASKEGGFFPLPLRNGHITMLGQELAPVPQVAPDLNQALSE